jgi:thiol-disulfide isomerase/thioredoxin
MNGAFFGFNVFSLFNCLCRDKYRRQAAGVFYETQWIKGKTPNIENSLTILELWRTSCSNCRDQIPHLSALQKAYGDRISIVTISREPIDVINQFMKTPSLWHWGVFIVSFKQR